jgi:tripartite-type tricarboxylate transporter receptor subunit TctC
LPRWAHAQGTTFPSKTVKLIIPLPASGATDYAARAIGGGLADLWRHLVVPENRAGAGSTVGNEAGAKSAPDGYTLVMGIPAGITIAPHIYPKLGYDLLVDLIPVAGFATSPLVVVVPVNSPFKTFTDLVAYAKANPGKLNYASNGNGSLPHLTTEWFLSLSKTKMAHIPYRGSALAMTGSQPTSRLPGVPTVARVMGKQLPLIPICEIKCGNAALRSLICRPKH